MSEKTPKIHATKAEGGGGLLLIASPLLPVFPPHLAAHCTWGTYTPMKAGKPALWVRKEHGHVTCQLSMQKESAPAVKCCKCKYVHTYVHR